MREVMSLAARVKSSPTQSRLLCMQWPPKLPLKRSKTGAVEVWEALVLFCDTHNYSREPGVRAWAAAVCANAYLFEAANRWWRKSFTEGLNALYRTFRMLTPGRQCSTAL